MSTIFQRLSDCRLCPTSARVCTLQVLDAAPQRRLSADTIYQELLSMQLAVSLGSVYRALKELEQHGLLLREWQFGADNRVTTYMIRPEAAAADAATCRLQCRRCGSAVTVHDPELQQHLSRVARLHGMDLGQSAVTLEVTCGACAPKPDTDLPHSAAATA